MVCLALEQKPEVEKPISAADRYADIADEIRGLDEDTTESLMNVMLELKKSNPGSVYVASKRYLDQKGLSVCDFGNIGILERFLPGSNGCFIGCPGDLIFYVQADRTRTDDILLLHYFDQKGFVRLYHARVLSFDLNGGIEVQDLGETKTRWVSRRKILGKFVGVISFGEPAWHDLIGRIVDRQFLTNRLKENLKWTESNNFQDKPERITELKRRIALLASDMN